MKNEQSNSTPEVPEQSNPWQSLARTADQDRGAMIIENEDEDYKRTRTQDYEESEQGQSELKIEAAFDRIAEDLDVMVAEGKISSEARDELLEKYMSTTIDLIDEFRANYETVKRGELLSRLARDFQKIEQKKAAQEKNTSSNENEVPDNVIADEEQASSSVQSDDGGVAQEPKTAETDENAQNNAVGGNVEPSYEAEELLRKKSGELLKLNATDLLCEEAQKLIDNNGNLEDKKIAKKAVSKDKDEFDAQIAALEQELVECGWQEGPELDTISEPELSSVGNSLEQIRNYIIKNKIGGAWGSAILLDTTPLNDTIKARNSAWWRSLSEPQRDEVIKYLKDTEKIAGLAYGNVVREWLTKNGWLAESQAPAAAA